MSRRYNKIRENRKKLSKGQEGRRFKKSSKKYASERRSRSTRSENRLADEIVACIYRNKGEADFKQISTSIGEARGQRKEIEASLTELDHQGVLHKVGKKNYRLDSRHFVQGTLSVHPKGFAFAEPSALDRQGEAAVKDIFIPARDVGSGLHGDQVLLQLTGSSRGRMEGRVVAVLQRVAKSLVGIYRAQAGGGSVIPEDDRYPFTIEIQRDEIGGADDGDAVLVEMQEWGQEQARATGRIIEVLGDPDSSQVQMQIVIRKFDLPHVFSRKSIEQVEAFSDQVECGPDRTDLRDVFHVTIDGETARDFDDAVSVLKTKTGFRLYVSIADVSHYVKTGTALDRDAWERGTSVYFPTGVLPMLPERLSNNLCSLNPQVDRYAFTAILDFDRSGNRLKSSFVKSVIRSAYRLTYTLVRQILVDQDPAIRKSNKPLLTPLKLMAELGVELEKKRMERGSMGFEIPETFVEVGPDDEITAITKRHRNLAHKIIEEFMLAANEAVAETFTRRNFAALYRIHQSPDTIKVAEFTEFVQSLGYQIPREKDLSRWFNKLISQAHGTPREYLISNLILRVMQQARYSPDNIGHFGLAAEFYTHFTSPIRRYPDLMVHRALQQLLLKKEKQAETSLEEAGEFLSKRERVAVDAEREMVDRLSVRYMESRTGEIFAAIISGVTSFGLFVQLTETLISGAVAVTDLPKDSYTFQEKRHALSGQWSGRVFQVGELVNVQLVSVDKRKQRINFVLSEDGEQEVA